jgi:uroporphyrinogen III methyltransferase/synthase
MTMRRQGLVSLVGAGPGDEGLLTLKGKAALEAADVVVYDLLANPALLAMAPASARRINAGKRAGRHVLTQDQTNALLIKLGKQGKRVVRLKGGDPFVFGRGGEEALELAKAGVAFEVVPGISSGIAAPAYAGIPVTHRGLATSAVFVTGQERSGKPLQAKTLKALAQLDSTLVFFMATESAARVTAALIKAGKPAGTPAALVHAGTTPRQKVILSTLGRLAGEMKAQGLGAPGLLVIGPAAGLRSQLRWFEARPLFGRHYVVTRSRDQASQLSQKLRSQGATVLEIPAIRIQALPLNPAMRQTFKRLSQGAWLLLTSANGVEHFFARLYQAGLDARALAHCKIAAVGQSTAAALAARGLQADLVPPTFDAEHLLKSLLKAMTAAERRRGVVLARAQEGRDILPQGLKRAGIPCTDLALYKTVAEKAEVGALVQAFVDGNIDAVTFASSSTVDFFKALFNASQWKQVAPRLRAFCLGPITRSRLEAEKLPVIGEAATASLDSLVACIVETHGSA